MKKLKIWILAARPKTLMASISPVCIGTALALKEGFFDPLMFFFILLTGLGIQVCVNFANDYFDYIKGSDVSTRKGPLRVMQAQLVEPLVMKKVMALAFCLTFCAGLYLVIKGGVLIGILLCLSLVLAFLYTAGPYSLSYLGLGDPFVIVFFGSLAVGGTYFLQTHIWSLSSLLIGLAPGAFSTAILTVNNLRDVEEDKRANKRTLVVRRGVTFGKWEYTFMVLIPFLISICVSIFHPFVLLSLLAFFPTIPLIRKVFTFSEPSLLNGVLAKTGQVLFLYSLLFSIGWML